MATKAPQDSGTKPSEADGASANVSPEDQDGEKALHTATNNGPDIPMSTWASSPRFGGAQSFSELDIFEEIEDREENVHEVVQQFQAIVRNIFADPEWTMAVKAENIRAAARDLQARVDSNESKSIDLETATAAELEEHRRGTQKQATKREAGADFKATDFASVGDAETPSTWKLRMAEGRSGNFTVAQIARAITAMQPSGFRGQRVELTAPKAQVVGRIRSAIGRAGGDDTQRTNLIERLDAVKDISFGRTSAGGSFTLREKDGELIWIGVYSNAFLDKDAEILSEAAHKEFIAHCERSQTWPVLELWHTPGTEFGKTKSIAFSDRFTVAMGTIDKGQEDVARRLVKRGELAMSHGFAFDPNDRDEGGVFKRYRTHEISVLPAGMAANELTGWSLNTEEIQMFEGKQRAFFVEALGEDDTKALEATLAKASDTAAAEGISFKDILTAVAEPEPKKDAGDGDGEKVQVEMPEAIAEVIKGVTEGFAEISKHLEAHVERLDILEKSDSEKLAEKIRPIRFPLSISAASGADETIVDGRKDQKLVRDANAADKAEYDPADPLGPYMAEVTGPPNQAAG